MISQSSYLSLWMFFVCFTEEIMSTLRVHPLKISGIRLIYIRKVLCMMFFFPGAEESQCKCDDLCEQACS